MLINNTMKCMDIIMCVSGSDKADNCSSWDCIPTVQYMCYTLLKSCVVNRTTNDRSVTCGQERGGKLVQSNTEVVTL